MDILSPLSFGIDVSSKLRQRPWLTVRIVLYRPEPSAERLVFRASVLNRGRLAATGCEGFWSVFDPVLKEISSGAAVFWTSPEDNDYDFRDRSCRRVTIETNERRFCWAELDLTPEPVRPTEIHLFPYNHSPGLYTFALLIEYGQYKSFDFVGINVPRRIGVSAPVDKVPERIGVQWEHHRGLRGLIRRCLVYRLIKQHDYHEYVRPT